MISLDDKAPDFLFGKYQMIMTVTFTALFALVFVLASIPFSHSPWFDLSVSESIGYTVIFFVICIALIAASKKLMYDMHKRSDMTFLQYSIWNIVEIVLVCFLYTFFTIQADRRGIISFEPSSLALFCNSIVYCTVSIAVPYVIAGMYFDIQDKENIIRMINYGNVVSDEILMPNEENKITLFDNNGVLKLSVNASNLYYIESDDNYIKVWYADSKGLLKQYMLRCRLKTVEDSFRGSDLLRCHRKYIVNMSMVKILSKEKDGYALDLGLAGIEPLPVTKTYEEQVLKRFNAR